MGVEGQDSTVRPKLKTWEFDQGRRYLDEWNAEGKPYLSKSIQSRIRFAKAILPFIVVPVGLFLVDFGPEETVVSPIQRAMHSWWGTFVALDTADVVKAKSVRRRPAPKVSRAD